MRIAVIARGIWPLVIGGAEVVDGLSGHELKVITKYKKEERRPEISVEIDEEWSIDLLLPLPPINIPC
ncbi:hypothetical protein M1O24_00030 [Dehalococcoidia bacterium]|nr:hypothetical protein [Dehalococcoidia bacterium]